jgi:hypothetical protein
VGLAGSCDFGPHKLEATLKPERLYGDSIFRHRSLRRVTTVLVVETTLHHALNVGLGHNKEGAFGAIQNRLVDLLQPLSRPYRKPRQGFSPTEFCPVVDIQSDISGQWLS